MPIINETYGIALIALNSSCYSSWSIFRLSYMWFSMVGCLLTVFLGWLISVIIDALQRRSVLKITAKGIDNPAVTEEVFKSDSPVLCTTMKPVELTSGEGHVNLAIRLDDEYNTK